MMIRKSVTYLDGCQSEGNLSPTINVRVHHTQNVLELLWDYQRLGEKSK